MGERLVVKIQRNDKLIATAYYHWSAYTVPALNIVKSMHDHVLCNASSMNDDELQLAMIRFAERSTFLGSFETVEERNKAAEECRESNKDKPENIMSLLEDLMLAHGGLDPFDAKYAAQKFPDEVFETGVSRNDGMVAISDNAMQDQIKWAEGIVEIDLDTNNVINEIVYEYDLESYLEETEDCDDDYYTEPKNLPCSPINLAEFSLDEVQIVLDVIEISQNSWIKYEDKIFQLKDG